MGKTFAVRKLGKSFQKFVGINFESQPEIKAIFEKDLNPERIILELSLALGKPIAKSL